MYTSYDIVLYSSRLSKTTCSKFKSQFALHLLVEQALFSFDISMLFYHQINIKYYKNKIQYTVVLYYCIFQVNIINDRCIKLLMFLHDSYIITKYKKKWR